MNGSANKVNGDVNGFVHRSSDSCRTTLDEMQMRSVQPPDVVTSQRRRDNDHNAGTTVDDDSLEVHPAGVDNPGYAEDSLEPVGRRVTPTFANGNATRRSPTRLQYVPPSTRSPLRGLMVDGRHSATPSASKLPRISPIQRPTSAGSGGGKRSAPLRSTPVGGLDNVYEEEPGTAAPTLMVRGRVLTPTVGLTVEQVDHITDSRRFSPAAAAAHSSTSSTGRGSSPDLVNRTDFTRDDLELVARPQSTSSDDDDAETQDETFTCSDYDCGGRRRAAPPPMLDFANPYRLRMAPSLALPSPPPLPPQPLQTARHSVTPRDSATPRDGGPSSSSGSTVDEMFSVDNRRHATPAGPDGTVDLSRAAAELGWTPNFDALAEVFLDIAALSDAGRLTAIASGRSPVASPVRSTPQPLTSHRPVASSSVRSDTPSSRTRSPMNNVDATAGDRVRPLQRLASPVERLASTDGHHSLTPTSQTARHTPLDGIHRRYPSSPAHSPLYMSPPPVYDGRGQNRMSSPRDRLASPPTDAAPWRRDAAAFCANDGRTVSPRGNQRPVLEEYV